MIGQKVSVSISNLKKYCEERLKGHYAIEVVDLLKNPQLADGEQIIATPMLIKKLPAYKVD